MKALKANKEMVYLSEKLATMKKDIVIQEDLNDLMLNIDIDELIIQLKKYEMHSLVSEIEKLR